MPELPFNEQSIKSAEPSPGERRTKYSFKDKPGLRLFVSRSEDKDGSPTIKRHWYARCSIGSGRERREQRDHPIGDLRQYTPKQAWIEATRVIQLARQGGDPRDERNQKAEQKAAEQRVAAANARTLEAVYREWLHNPKRKRTPRPATIADYEQKFRKHIAPRLGSVPIASLTQEQIEQAVEQVRIATIGGVHNGRGYSSFPVQALIRSVCRYATKRGYISVDPTLALERPVPRRNPGGAQHRAPTESELRAIWNSADQHINPSHARALKIALLLGRRASEIVLIERRELQLEGDRPVWTVPADREGNKSREEYLVPLPPLAVVIFREQIASVSDSPFVFQARRKAHQPMTRFSASDSFLTLRRALGIAENVRFHDARKLVSDQMAMMRVPIEYRSHVLQHTSDFKAALANSVYSTYDFEPEKRRALRLWALRLQEIVRDQKPRGLRW